MKANTDMSPEEQLLRGDLPHPRFQELEDTRWKNPNGSISTGVQVVLTFLMLSDTVTTASTGMFVTKCVVCKIGDGVSFQGLVVMRVK